MEQEKMAKYISEMVIYDIQYVPGSDEDFDLFVATYEPLNISSYGTTKEEALMYAKEQLKSMLIGDTETLLKMLETVRQ